MQIDRTILSELENALSCRRRLPDQRQQQLMKFSTFSLCFVYFVCSGSLSRRLLKFFYFVGRSKERCLFAIFSLFAVYLAEININK